ncbi:MAG: N-acetylmuramic acid 6-phosphate etherase [Jatrophihabitantaceae bacterium]
MQERPQLDVLPAGEIVELLLDAESRVVPAVRAVTEQIAAGAELIAARLAAGARLLFAGAGTSGRIAAAEAAELPGTFGLDRRRIGWRIAGGSDSTDDDEDDLAGAHRDIADLAITEADVLVAVAASGATPYTLALAAAARQVGAAVIAVVTVPGSPLADLADVAIAPSPGPEVLRGSSRLTAGTAQKITLNALLTSAMARSGRVHGDLMVDVVPANAKLRRRVAGIVAEIAAVDQDRAEQALRSCDHDARAAVLMLVAGLDPVAARRRAAAHRSLRDALEQ